MFFTSIGCHVVFKGPPKRSADRGHTFFSHQPWLSPPHQYPERYRQNLGKAAEIQKTQNTHINQKPFVLMALLLLFIKENALNCFPLLPTYGSPNCWQLKSYLEDFFFKETHFKKRNSEKRFRINQILSVCFLRLLCATLQNICLRFKTVWKNLT